MRFILEFSPRQTEIIEAANHLILNDGLEGLTTKNLAKKIGITEAALYRHFPSKLEILLAMITYFERRAVGLLQDILSSQLNGFDKIHQILRTRVLDFQKNPATMVVILSEEIFPNESELSRKVSELIQMNQKAITELLQSAQNENVIRKDTSAEQLFFILLGSFRFLVTRWRLTGFQFDLVNEFEKVWSVLERMLLKEINL